ncbi:MAG: hypothetical protein ACXU86_23810, partial [Archangium sp.]
MSSSRTLSVTVLTVTAMLGSATAWWWSRSPAEASDTPPSRVRAAALPPSSREGSAEAAAAQVEALRREVEVLRQQNQQLAQRMDSVGAQAPRPAESHPLPPEQAMAREVARREAYFGKLDAAYQQEARDAPWAQQTEALVASALRR